MKKRRKEGQSKGSGLMYIMDKKESLRKQLIKDDSSKWSQTFGPHGRLARFAR